ncbi:MAG: BrnT family toxin [Terriglobia bacterium]
MEIRFEWDERKAAQNQRKHGVSFDEATTVFSDPLSATIPDPLHSPHGEERFVTMGLSAKQNLLVVVHLDSGETIRIISARRTTRRERRNYEKAI